MLKSVSLNSRFIYVYSSFGCSVVSSNLSSFKIPAGFFALERGDIESYFTNGYLVFDVDDRDVLFNVYCYDFSILSVQSLSDFVNVLSLKILSDSLSALKGWENYCRIDSNNSGLGFQAYLGSNSSVDVGFFSVTSPFDADSVVVNLPDDLDLNSSFFGTCHVSFRSDYDVPFTDYDVNSGPYQVFNRFVRFDISSFDGSVMTYAQSFLSSSFSWPIIFKNSNFVFDNVNCSLLFPVNSISGRLKNVLHVLDGSSGLGYCLLNSGSAFYSDFADFNGSVFSIITKVWQKASSSVSMSASLPSFSSDYLSFPLDFSFSYNV